jgi:hypothetical protein
MSHSAAEITGKEVETFEFLRFWILSLFPSPAGARRERVRVREFPASAGIRS